MTDLNGAGIDLDADEQLIAEREVERLDYVLNLIAHRIPEIEPDDLAVLAESNEPLGEGELLSVEIGAQILEVVDQLMVRMERLEAMVPNSDDIVASLWRAMRDHPIEAKLAVLNKLESLVAMEDATHHRLQ